MKNKPNKFPCLMMLFETGMGVAEYVHVHSEDDLRRIYAKFQEKRGWSCTAALHQYSTEFSATDAEHHADVAACMAEPHSSTKEPKPTYEQLEAKIVLLEGWLAERRKEVDRLYQEGRSPRGVIEMLQQELRAERGNVASLQRRLWDDGTYIRKLKKEIAEHREKVVPTFGAPIAGMTFPFTIDTPHRDIVELTVTGVDITDGVHRVHMTADIRLPEAQPQEVPSPVGEPTFVEVRDVPGVVTQLSLDLVAPLTDPVAANTSVDKEELLKHIDVKTTNPDAPPFVDLHTYTASKMFGVSFKEVTADMRNEAKKEHLNLLAYEQAGAVADSAPKLTEDTENMKNTNKEVAMVVSRMEPTVVNGWEVLEENGSRLVRDIDIAERAGLAKPRNIRATIKANKDALEKFGALQVRPQCGRTRMPQERGVREDQVNEYWLNERQAIRLVQYLRTPASKEMNENVFTSLMDLFDSFRRGELVPSRPIDPLEFAKLYVVSETARRTLEKKYSYEVAASDGMAEAITNLSAAHDQLSIARDSAVALAEKHRNKAEEYDAITEVVGGEQVSVVAKLVGKYNQKFFFALLREDGFIRPGYVGTNIELRTDPYMKYVRNGVFFLKHNKDYLRTDPETGAQTVETSTTTQITPKGVELFRKMYGPGGTHRRHPTEPNVGLEVSLCNRELSAEERSRRKLARKLDLANHAERTRHKAQKLVPTQKEEDE